MLTLLVGYFFKQFILVLIMTCMCEMRVLNLCICAPEEVRGICPLELQSHDLDHLMLVLGTELRSSARAALAVTAEPSFQALGQGICLIRPKLENSSVSDNHKTEKNVFYK